MNGMDLNQIDSKYVEIAVQTVLYQNKERLGQLASHEDEEFIKYLSEEIVRKAIQFQKITDSAVQILENT
jgi:hypothetical protein